MLSLNLAKPGENNLNTTSRLALNLAKPAKFSVELSWDSAEDLDAHALLATNDGTGAAGGTKVTSMERVLSTFNAKKTNKDGLLVNNPDGSFSTPEKALTHSGDARTGIGNDVDEIITVDGSKVPADVNEIPIFVTIYPSKATKFGAVKQAGIRIKDERGKMLGEYQLSQQFGEFDAVQMGSLMLGSNGWEFAPVGVGFTGDFNTILGNFS